MPLQNNHYYYAYHGLFMASSLRFELTRAQWAVYRDLVDLLYANGGRYSSNRAHLTRTLFPDSPEDLEAVLSCRHVYESEGVVRHTVIDKYLSDMEEAKEWGRKMGRRSAEKRRERTVQRRRSTTPLNVTVGDPQSVIHKEGLTEGRRSTCSTAVPSAAGRDTPLGAGSPSRPAARQPEMPPDLAGSPGEPPEPGMVWRDDMRDWIHPVPCPAHLRKELGLPPLPGQEVKRR